MVFRLTLRRPQSGRTAPDHVRGELRRGAGYDNAGRMSTSCHPGNRGRDCPGTTVKPMRASKWVPDRAARVRDDGSAYGTLTQFHLNRSGVNTSGLWVRCMRRRRTACRHEPGGYRGGSGRFCRRTRPADGCGRDAIPLAVKRRYDSPELRGYLENVGSFDEKRRASPSDSIN